MRSFGIAVCVVLVVLTTAISIAGSVTLDASARSGLSAVERAVKRVSQSTSALRRAARRSRQQQHMKKAHAIVEADVVGEQEVEVAVAATAAVSSATDRAGSEVESEVELGFDGFEHWSACDAAWTAAKKPSLFGYPRSKSVLKELHPTSYDRIVFTDGTALSQTPVAVASLVSPSPSAGDEKSAPGGDEKSAVAASARVAMDSGSDFWGNPPTAEAEQKLVDRTATAGSAAGSAGSAARLYPTANLREACTNPGLDNNYRFPLLIEEIVRY